MTEGVKERASGSFPTVVGTFDALHLAAALAWIDLDPSENLILMTCDSQMTTCARAIGLPLVPIITS